LGWVQLLRLSTQVELHCPFAHDRLITFCVLQARAQAPQWSTSAPTFFSQPSPELALQSANWLLHTMPQLPEMHFGVLFGRPGHTTPQPPQWRVLVCVFTHCPLQFTSGGEHTVVHVPAWQTFPVPHLTPHAPQFELSVWVLVQTLVHFVYPPLQPKLQLPLAHSGKPLVGGGAQSSSQAPQFGNAFGSTHWPPHLMVPPVQLNPHCPPEQNAWPFGGDAHPLPQAPQWSTSETVSTHWPPQLVVPPGQLVVHEPFEHTFSAPHALPHAPQWSLSVWVFTHSLPHKSSPVPQLGAQAPPTHAMLPPVGAGGHALPHAPQWALSLEVLTQAPLHLVYPLLQA